MIKLRCPRCGKTEIRTLKGPPPSRYCRDCGYSTQDVKDFEAQGR